VSNLFKSIIIFLFIIIIFNNFIKSENLFFNEIMSRNDIIHKDNDGDFTDWIEIYNASTSQVNLDGYILTDNPNLLSKWTFGPITIFPDSFIIIYASDKDRSALVNDLHTNFKIKSSGEVLILSDQNGEIIDSLFTGLIPSNFSKGRQPDGSNNWVYFENPSPGKSNLSDGLEEFKVVDLPNFSQKGGFYDSSITLTLSLSNNIDNVILYSQDGSNPNIVYSDEIYISKTTVLRIQSYDPSEDIKSKILTETFFINEEIDHSLPVFSIATSPNNLFGDDGILEEENFVWGPNNALIDTEVPINIEMYEEGYGHLAFNYLAGVELFGSGSTFEPQKSLAIYFRSKYDVGELSYKLFPNSPISEFESFILRNSGNDMYSTHIRDGLSVSLLDQNSNLDYQNFRPAIVFLNGEYYGILNIREKINEHFIEHHHFISQENLDLLSYKEVQQPVIIQGDINQYTDLLIYLHNKDLDKNESYPYINDIIDIENFIEYQVMEIYAGNIDWPGNNHKFWKSKYDGSKWRWILFDTDTGYGLWDDWWQDGKIGYTVNHFNHATSVGYNSDWGGWPNPPFSTYVFRKLLENESFKNQFINRFLDLLNTTLSPQNVLNTIDSLLINLESSLPRHLDRWSIWDEEDLVEIHNYEIKKLKSFATNRTKYIRTHMKDFFNLNIKETTLKLKIFPESSGNIKINSIIIEDSDWVGTYFEDIPITLIAESNPGFKFLGWQSNSIKSSKNKIKFFPEENNFTAIFKPDTSGSIIINEINHSSFNVAESEDWIEIFNSTAEDIELENWTLSDNSLDVFTFSNQAKILKNNYLIIAKDLEKFTKIHSQVKNVIGNIPFGLSSDTDSIILKNEFGDMIDLVAYNSSNTWPLKINDSGQTLELNNYSLDNSLGENWSLSRGYGTPGKKNSIYEVLLYENKTTLDSTLSSSIKNYPNPFSENATIEFFPEKDGLVEIKIFNILGKHITTLSNMNRPSGIYFDSWNGVDLIGNNVSSGVYIVVLYINSKVYASHKMLIF